MINQIKFFKNVRITSLTVNNKVYFMNGTNRAELKPGLRVLIVLKKDQKTGKLTEGIVKNILTKSSIHHHGIKVRLESGEIGRIKEILDNKES